jgi:hypothetical protein
VVFPPEFELEPDPQPASAIAAAAPITRPRVSRCLIVTSSLAGERAGMPGPLARLR